MNLEGIDEDVVSRARNVRLLLMDCDGVLTDGRLYFSAAGESMKVFHVRDGQGLSLWHQRGLQSGIITGRGSGEILEQRTKELRIDFLRTNSADKRVDFDEILAIAGVAPGEVAYIGDDIGDIDLLKIVGLPATVADGASAVAPYVKYRTAASGGFGAVRELIDLILASQS